MQIIIDPKLWNDVHIRFQTISCTANTTKAAHLITNQQTNNTKDEVSENNKLKDNILEKSAESKFRALRITGYFSVFTPK